MELHGPVPASGDESFAEQGAPLQPPFLFQRHRPEQLMEQVLP
jgi:hypothetical protein